LTVANGVVRDVPIKLVYRSKRPTSGISRVIERQNYDRSSTQVKNSLRTTLLVEWRWLWRTCSL